MIKLVLEILSLDVYGIPKPYLLCDKQVARYSAYQITLYKQRVPI